MCQFSKEIVLTSTGRCDIIRMKKEENKYHALTYRFTGRKTGHMTRSEFLMEYAPDTYNAMKKNGTLDSHISSAHENVSDMVDRAAERAMNSPEYLEAQSKGDYKKMTQIVATEKMIANHEAERMFVYAIDDEHKQELEAFESKICYYSGRYGNAYDNFYYDKEHDKYVRMNEDELDSQGYDEYNDYYPTYEEVCKQRDSAYRDLVEELLDLDQERRYGLYEYLEIVFNGGYSDRHTGVLRNMIVNAVKNMDDSEPMKRIVQYYLDEDESGLDDYVHYREPEEPDRDYIVTMSEEDYNELITILENNSAPGRTNFADIMRNATMLG